MRLENDDKDHGLGTFQLLDVSEEEEAEFIQPDSIDGDPGLGVVVNEPAFKAEWISKRARLAIYSFAVVIGMLMTIDVAISIYDFWKIHWSLGAGLLLTVIVLTFLSARAIYEWVKGKNGVELVHELQNKAEIIKADTSESYDTRQLFEDLREYYLNTPQEQAFSALVDDFPDYLTDKERLEQFEDRFISPIDRKVEAIIQKYSVQTGIAVTASPLPSLDAFLTVWRNVLMINEIASAYGVTPTLPNRLKVLSRVGRNVIYSGLSQYAVDSFIDLSNTPLAGKVLSNTLQGIGVGIATARVGNYSATVCRPILAEDEGCYSSKFYQSIAAMIGKKVITAQASGAGL